MYIINIYIITVEIKGNGTNFTRLSFPKLLLHTTFIPLLSLIPSRVDSI